MKFIFEIKHNENDIQRAEDIKNNLQLLAVKNQFDLEKELLIELTPGENESIEIYPKMIFNKGEFLEGRSENFTKDYLSTYANLDDIYLDFGEIEEL